MNLKEFQDELITEFNLNRDTFKCYTLESTSLIKVFVFGKKEWRDCCIGFLINGHFHVLGLGAFSFVNEDAKALYVNLSCPLPENEQVLKVRDYTVFSEEEQSSIKNKLNEIFINQSNL